MIMIEIKGGIGNQLFQYAAARSLAYQNNSKLGIDKSFFEINGYSKRELSLQHLNINPKIKFISMLKKIKYLRKIGFLSKYLINDIVEEKSNEFIYEKINYKYGKLNVMTGYFQSYKFFEDIRPILIEEIKPRKKSIALNKYINLLEGAKKTVSLHVRRGDYVELGWELEINYYINALNEIIKKVEIENPLEIFVFSDDLLWCENNILNEIPEKCNVTLVDDNSLKDYEEIFLMSLCDNNIISNSTFSWWGAWLNQKKDKIVISPEKWIDNKNVKEFDIIPKEWIIISGENCE